MKKIALLIASFLFSMSLFILITTFFPFVTFAQYPASTNKVPTDTNPSLTTTTDRTQPGISSTNTRARRLARPVPNTSLPTPTSPNTPRPNNQPSNTNIPNTTSPNAPPSADGM